MRDRGLHSYPPVGDPNRLDAIVQRGRALQRRRQYGAAGAGAGGALAVVLVAVLVFGGGSGEDDQLLADDGTTTTTTETTTTTTVPEPEMTVELVQGPPAQIVVDDPAQPVGEGTQQCLTVAAYEPETTAADGALPVAEGTVCAPGLSGNGQADLALVPTTSSEAGPGAEVTPDLGGGRTEINCAASVVRPAADAVASTETQPGVTAFTISAPDLAPGQYRMVVSAVSGIGDGCAPEQEGLEREHVAETSGTISLP